ncbi:MAG: lasso peptide biosynthesis B2 protein [Thermoleophilaceae bacterium]
MTALEKLALSAEITLAYVQVRWLMRRGDLRAALAKLRSGGRPPGAAERGAAVALAGRLGSIVDGRLRHLPGDTRCLARSLVLVKLLARRGLPDSVVVIGVRTAPAFGAHAWVELEGRSLLQPIEAGGSRLVEL